MIAHFAKGSNHSVKIAILFMNKIKKFCRQTHGRAVDMPKFRFTRILLTILDRSPTKEHLLDLTRFYA
jgi:hypothetical protein